ncbi:dihydrofolate reductase family protein [Enterococcus sp. AZ109]|uniref:dihydrofolate reductase family protein n=1 Tax=Enterococcus sp. AZ109 TaxID=2774634 RepID=UPI003F685D25
MRKVIFYGAISLDGYLAGKNEDLEWLLTTNTGETTSYEEFIKTIGTVVMGRITYQEALKLTNGAPLYPEQEMIIFSRNHEIIDGQKTVSSDPVAYIKELREKRGKDIWLVGGADLLTPLISANLIDHWYIQIAPVLLGKGKRLFDSHSLNTRLRFVEMRQFGELVELHYCKANLPRV